jgi:CDK inhibitor PHO81
MGRVLSQLQGTYPPSCTSTDIQALKKIINSYAAGRSAADASLLSLGLRPPKRPLGPSAGSESSTYAEHVEGQASASGNLDLDPLPPTTEPPAPKGIMLEGGRGRNAKEDSFKAHRDVFFFTLQRELEKVCLDILELSRG